MVYGDFKDLTTRTASDKILRDKAFNIAKNEKCDGYKRGLASMIYEFFDKKNLQVDQLRIKLNKMNTLQMNFINQLLENLKKEYYISHLKTIFWVQMLQICN